MRSFCDSGRIGRQVRLFGPLRLEFANFLSHFSRGAGFLEFWPFDGSKFRSFGSSEVSGLSELRRDIRRDLGRSRLGRADFLSQDAQFLGFRLDRPPSAPFRAAALVGFATFLGRFSQVPGYRKFRSFCRSKFRSFRTLEAVGSDIFRDYGRSRLE